jgi:aspartate racemase
MAQHIGIVACSSEGAALCYRTICLEAAALFGRYGHPEITMHTPSLLDYVQCLDRADWRGVGALMLASADKLAKSGADFLICPDNTIHQALTYIEARLPLPWLHIGEAVAEAAIAGGFRRLALTGTRWLLESTVYSEKLGARGLEWALPSQDEIIEINRIIMEELVCGVRKSEAVAYTERVIRRLQGLGCDAVVLGCTELPLIITDANSALPTLDSTALLARAALKRATRA